MHARRLALALAILPMVAMGARAADTVGQEWSGSGLTTTRPMTFSSPWEMQWDATGFLQIYLLDEGGQLVELLANQGGKGAGSTYEPKTGAFILKFNGIGPWRAKAVLISK